MSVIDVRTKTLLLQYIHDDNHFLNDFLKSAHQDDIVLLNTEAHGAEILLYAMQHLS